MMKSKKNNRCNICNKKVNIMMLDRFTCRCKGVYCNLHLHDHGCNFDYNENFKEKMATELVKVEPSKVNNI